MLEIDLSTFPILHTERLVLREVVDADAGAVLRLRSDPEVMAYIGRPRCSIIEEAAALISLIGSDLAANSGITWAVALKDRPADLIGTIGYWRITKEHHRAELGYMLMPDHGGQGLMNEAFATVLDHGFQMLRLHSVEARVNPGNVASIAVLERNGFVIEAFFKEDFHFNGKFHDTAVYSLRSHLTSA